MSGMTMQQEIELLREEVQKLKAGSKEIVAAGDSNVGEDGDGTEKSLSSVKGMLEHVEDDVKEQMHELVDVLKKDYDAVSPVSVVLLFAAGVLFGRILSSR